MDEKILIAGFGGQGILFAGKVLSYYALQSGDYVSWLPSYGPEMRGGTAYCAVTISSQPIGSPVITAPDILIVMNKPSFTKFIDTVESNGVVFVDSTLVDDQTQRTDITTHYVPATQTAHDMGVPKLANMVLLGELARVLKLDTAILKKALEKSIGEGKVAMLEKNLSAMKIG